MAERSNAAVSKTVSGGFVRRGFKSLPLRFPAGSRFAPGDPAALDDPTALPGDDNGRRLDHCECMATQARPPSIRALRMVVALGIVLVLSVTMVVVALWGTQPI